MLIFHYIFFDNLSLVPELSICTDVYSEALVDWTNYIREVCIDALSVNKIGGKNKVVEIDESLFGKRKYNRGRINKGQYWVFGGGERGTNKCFLIPVLKRDSATLLPIIKNNILPGSTIISDCWKAYDCLGNEGYRHLKVNHTYNFVDPDTGAHINTIEGLWSHAKASLPDHGRSGDHLPGYLARFMWRKDKKREEIFANFLSEIAKQYPI